MNAERYVLLDSDGCSRKAFRRLLPTLPSSAAETREALRGGNGEASIWLAMHADAIRWISAAIEGSESGRLHRALITDRPLTPVRLLALSSAFGRIVCPPFVRLPDEELANALMSPDRADRCIAGSCDAETGWITLLLGDLQTLVVPLSACKPRPVGPVPDPARFAVVDVGDAFALGEWECTFDAALYEWDPAYRRRLNAYRRATDRMFGAALRRLRLQKDLHQDAFAPLPAKTVARIERGEIRKPHRRTLEILARKLGVKPEEIATF